MAPGSSSASASDSSIPIWDLDDPALDEWVKTVRSLFPSYSEIATYTPAETSKFQLAPILWRNLQNSLAATNTHPVLREDDTAKADADESTPPAKRAKTNVSKRNVDNIRGHALTDPYKIWMHSKEVASSSDKTETNGVAYPALLMEAIPSTAGAKVAELSVMGMVNGLGGQLGGLVDKLGNPLTPDIKSKPIAFMSGTATVTAILDEIREIAFALHQSVQTRLEKDVLNTTPLRIHMMLAPDLSPQEFKAVQRRIYDTVVLGKGLKGEDLTDDIPVATNAQSVHDSEKFKKCKVCGENDQSNFILDRKNGDVICSTCGTVVSESLMHEGSQFRKFEGEVDRNHHGDPGNPLYSNAHNMGTTLGGIQMTSGAGMGGFGSQGKGRGLETILRNAHAYTELNVSSFGTNKDNVGRTRVGYKDKQKKQAFIQMNHVGDALNLHEAVIQRAKEIFAGFRDDRELLHQLKAVIAGCICIAFEQLARDGRKILQQQEQGIEDGEEDGKDDKDEKISSESITTNKKVLNNRRAMHRAELHKASMAGKGGLLLDFSEVKNTTTDSKPAVGVATNTAGAAAGATSLDHKPASTWDLEDCRSWLLEASRSIAQTWVDERDGTDPKKNAPGTRRDIPKGGRDELEGKLVEHSIVLCEFLETQLKTSASKAGQPAGRRVVTPRVRDMSQLGIKWQHAHERGSGGKGGVGNSGHGGAAALMAKKKGAAAPSSSRNAGQILIIQSAAKLGTILKDPLAGESFHRELRAVIGRQEARKSKELRDEATRQRLMQMKRKPWLQAKITGST